MKLSPLIKGLLAMGWDELGRREVTKKELRTDGWSEGKIKRFLGKPSGRHSSTHFLSRIGQPYWMGQQVLAAAVQGGFAQAEAKNWPFQAPVPGLRTDYEFMAFAERDGRLFVHSALAEAWAKLGTVRDRLVQKAAEFPQLAQLNSLATPGVPPLGAVAEGLGLRTRHFPESVPARECVDLAHWYWGKPEELAAMIESYGENQELKAALQVLPDVQARIEAIAEDVESDERRYESLGSWELARLCGIEPGDGDGNQVNMSYWKDVDDCDEPFLVLDQMEPYVSPERWKWMKRWSERISEYEAEFDLKRLRAREREVFLLLYNNDGLEDRAHRAICTHVRKDRKGRLVKFQFNVGDGGSVEGGSGPYDFDEDDGIPCDEEICHPKTGKTLSDYLWKAPKAAKES